MFDAAARDRIQALLVERARADERVAAAALLGSLTTGQADRWSDLDLALAVAEGIPVTDVVNDWSQALSTEFRATVLLDLEAGRALYRVFLLPGWLQVDLSFAPGGRVLKGGPRLELLFGETSPMPSTPPSPENRFGWGVVYARHAFVCLQRERWWQAAYCITEVRNAAMDLACLARGLPAKFGRAYDDLPSDLLARFEPTVFSGLSSDDLFRAMRAAVSCLSEQGAAVPWAEDLRSDLAALANGWLD